jgi:P-type E1-E2 ATPase
MYLKSALKVLLFLQGLLPFKKPGSFKYLNHHSIGYLGDGINDSPSLKAVDIGISVYTACDIAKDAADLILTKKDLLVLKDGILEGFSNDTHSNSH